MEKKMIYENWSGHDILRPNRIPTLKLLKIEDALNFLDKNIWIVGLRGLVIY